MYESSALCSRWWQHSSHDKMELRDGMAECARAGAVEAKLQERAAMQHRGPSLAEAAASTKLAAQRIRASMAAADLIGLAGRAARTAKALRVPARPPAQRAPLPDPS